MGLVADCWVCYHPCMRPLVVAALLLPIARPLVAADPLAEARRLYNLGQYETAERRAREAPAIPARADAARVVLGRIQLERYRQSSDPKNLNLARESLRGVDTAPLDAAERVELTIGLAEALYFEDKYRRGGRSSSNRCGTLGAARHAGARARARLVGDFSRSAWRRRASQTSGRPSTRVCSIA